MTRMWHGCVCRGRQFAVAMAVVATVALMVAGPAASSVSAIDSVVDGTVVYGQLPASGTPTVGGTIRVAQVTGSTPEYILPDVPAGFTGTASDALITNLFLPLYTGPNGPRPEVNSQLDLAELPVSSDGGRVYTIQIKPGFRWADGAPVDAHDVVFGFDLLKAAVDESPAKWPSYIPGEFPTSVTSIAARGPDTVRITLDAPENPGFFLYNQLEDSGFGLFALPSTAWNIDRFGGAHLDYTTPANAKKIYNFLTRQARIRSRFATSPLWKDVDGPYRLASFNKRNGAYVLQPNPSYGGSAKAQASIQTVTYGSSTSAVNALLANHVDIETLSPGALAQSAALQSAGDSVFGSPAWGWFGGIINFKDRTDHFNKVIAQVYVRTAIERLVDQPAIVSTVLQGAAFPQYGPVPAAPLSPYAPSSSQYPADTFNPAAAVAALTAHGWLVRPGRTTRCRRAGTASDDCGAGIPAGTPIKFVWANVEASEGSTGPAESAILATAARQYAGIDIELRSKSFVAVVSRDDDEDPADVKYENDWGVNNYGGFTQNDYPTQFGIDSLGGGFNFGGYDSPTANRLIDASVASASPSAITSEANYLARNPPVFYLPDPDALVAVSSRVGGSSQGLLALTQSAFQPQYLYVTG